MATDEIGAHVAWPPSVDGGGPARWHACRLTRMPTHQKTSICVQARPACCTQIAGMRMLIMHTILKRNRSRARAYKTRMGRHALHARAGMPMSAERRPGVRIPDKHLHTHVRAECTAAGANNLHNRQSLMPPNSARCRSRGQRERRLPQREALGERRSHFAARPVGSMTFSNPNVGCCPPVRSADHVQEGTMSQRCRPGYPLSQRPEGT